MRDDNGYPVAFNGGRRVDDFGGWTDWAVFDRADLDVERTLQEAAPGELAQDLTGWRYEYRGPGRAFHETPCVRVGRTMILVKQSGGYDV